MKKKIVILGVAIAALTLGVATFAIATNINKEASPLDAEAYNDKTSVQNGLFVKVTDLSSSQNGEDLLLVGDDVHTFQHHLGASYHYWLTTEYGGATATLDNRNAVYCDNAKGELVTLEKDANNVFYLRLKHYVDNATTRAKVSSGYIVQEAYNNAGVTAFGDLYIRDKKDKPSKAAATWELNFNESRGTMQITSKLNNRPLFWKQGSNYQWSSFACSTNESLVSNVNLYRKINSSDVAISITQAATKTTYMPGEPVDLSGLVINARYPYSGDPIFSVSSSYDSYPSLFGTSYVSYAYKSVFFKWCGVEHAFSITAAHDTSNEILFLKPDTEMKDLRGTYLLGADIQPGGPNGFITTVVLDTSSISRGEASDADFTTLNTGTAAVALPENPISSYYYDSISPTLDKERVNVMNNLVEIVCKENATETYVEYSIKIDNKLLFIEDQPPQGFDGGDPSTWGSFGKLKLSDINFATTANTVHTDEHNHVFIGSAIERQLVIDYSLADGDHVAGRITTVIAGDDLNENQVPLCLYKLQLSDRLNHYQELSDFKDEFFTITSSYDPTGVNRDGDVTRINWGSIETTWDTLSLDAQGYLASLTYKHNQEAANSFELLVDRYDGIFNTHYDIEGGFNDFMRRGLAGTLQSNRNVKFDYVNCSIVGADTAEFKSTYSATVVPELYFECPDSVEILMGEVELSNSKYSYNSLTGQITIDQNVIVDDILIKASAKTAPTKVYYAGLDNNGNELIIANAIITNNKHVLLSYEDAGFTYAPAGRQFKCWLVNGVERSPGYEIDVDDNILVTAYFESTDPAINELEERTLTRPSLSLSYEKDGNNFTFSDVTIRFRAIIAKSLLQTIDGNNENVQGYGVLLTTEEYLAGADLKSFVNQVIGPDGEPTSGIDNVNVKDYRSSNRIPTSYTTEQFGGISEESYIWNLRKYVGTTTEALTTRYVAVAYLITKNNGAIFLSQATASVKSLAQRMLDNGQCDEQSYDGAIKYLADL